MCSHPRAESTRPANALRTNARRVPEIGVFAGDAPVRPNPIGLTVVELLGREGTTLNVKGLDACDGAPVLDIKPYTEDRIVADARMASWHEDLLRKTGAKRRLTSVTCSRVDYSSASRGKCPVTSRRPHRSELVLRFVLESANRCRHLPPEEKVSRYRRLPRPAGLAFGRLPRRPSAPSPRNRNRRRLHR
ncbi:MAG: SAM-dependent methyltransferase [Actinobacteria bacterium]|nr:SAM-dependent methyltransferase [Actinomycetota bacterium]